jgi:hypothetical protein
VKSGVKVGELIVVRGSEALRDDAPVKVSQSVGGSGAPKQKAQEPAE